jgi:hypothetical protein
LPLYDLAAVAHAVDVPAKQLDNLLSRNALPSVEKKRRGLARRLPREIAVAVKLASDLATTLDIPTGKLLRLAHEIERSDRAELMIGEFAKLEINLSGLRAYTAARLDEAVEVVGRRRRGRPPVAIRR